MSASLSRMSYNNYEYIALSTSRYLGSKRTTLFEIASCFEIHRFDRSKERDLCLLQRRMTVA